MFGGTFDAGLPPLSTFVAVVAVGGTIKLMDDFTDRSLDAAAGKETWAARVGDGTLPYTLVCMAVAVYARPDVAFTLFLAAYALGMGSETKRRLPSGLTGVQEGVAALVLGGIVGGWQRMLASTLHIVFVQCVDDLRDGVEDTRTGHRSFVTSFGATPTALLGLGVLIIATTLSPFVTACIPLAAALVEAAARRGVRPLRHRRGQGG